MKNKSLFLLLIFTISLLPLNIAYAEVVPQRTLYDALNLMYISDALLLDVDFPEEVLYFPGLLSPSLDNPAVDPDNAALAAALHALKAMRNDLDAKCNLLGAIIKQLGEDCEVEKVNSLCAEKKQLINAEIGKLHDKRGDRRRGPTKIWHWLKRSGRGFWYRIGPVGRRFLRQVGPEAMQMVATGGMSGSVLRNLLKQTARSMGRNRIREIVFKGVERLLQGQIDLAREAGVDICEPDDSIAGSTSDQSNGGNPDQSAITYHMLSDEIKFFWHSMLMPNNDSDSCGRLWPHEDEFFLPIEFQLTINPQDGTLQAELAGQRDINNHTQGEGSGPLSAQLHQSFSLKMDDEYEISEVVEGKIYYFTGSAHLNLTQSGKRLCHYWEVPSSGSAVLIEYWVEGNESRDFSPEYMMILSRDEESTGTLELWIHGPESWGYNTGFSFTTQDLDLKTDDFLITWPE